MPIKSLELYLFERGLVGSYPIESLRNTTLGIDVNHYISRLLTSRKEQFLDAIGGFPTSLKLYLESDLKIFQEFNISPVFVFDGSLTQNQLEASGYLTACSREVAAASTASVSNDLVNGGPGSQNQAIRTDKELIFMQRHRAWTQWSNLMTSSQNSYIDQPIQPHEPFRSNAMMECRDFYSDLIAYFIKHDVVYQVAPFAAWAQLSYLLENNYIDAIYGPTDCLLLKNVDKFILGMEFPNKDFRFIGKSRVLREFHCSHEEFIDIAMAVGNDLQPMTLPPLQIYPANKLFEIALDMVINTGTNFYAYQLANAASEVGSSCVERYQRGISSLKYMPVLLDTGVVDIYVQDSTKNEKQHSPTSAENVTPATSVSGAKAQEPSSPASKEATTTTTTTTEISTTGEANTGEAGRRQSEEDLQSPNVTPIPNDIHDVIGQRLPNEYYFYKSIGLSTGKLFDAITTGVYPEEPPLDGGSSNSYRELIAKTVEEFKNKELNLLTQPINRYFQMKTIKQMKWFSPNNPATLVNRTSPSFFDRLNHLVVRTDDLDKTFSLAEFVSVINASEDLSSDFISKNVLFPNSVPPEKKLNSAFDLLATAFLRTLVQLGFFNYDKEKATLQPTVWGSVFLKFNELNINPEFYERFFILLMFLKLRVLGLSEETKPSVRSALSDHTLRSYPQESLYILVLTRLLTLYQLEQKPANYHGPIDKKTLIFREHLDFVRENLNDMYESMVISSLTSNEFNRLSLDNFAWQQKIVLNMVFKLSLPNTIMAMMWEFLLQKYLHNGNAKNDAIALVTTEFNTYKSLVNLNEKLEQSIEYLEQASRLLTALANSKLIERNDADLFKNAVEFAKSAILEK